MSAALLSYLADIEGNNRCQTIAAYYEGAINLSHYGVFPESQAYVASVEALIPASSRAGPSAGGCAWPGVRLPARWPRWRGAPAWDQGTPAPGPTPSGPTILLAKVPSIFLVA